MCEVDGDGDFGGAVYGRWFGGEFDAGGVAAFANAQGDVRALRSGGDRGAVVAGCGAGTVDRAAVTGGWRWLEHRHGLVRGAVVGGRGMGGAAVRDPQVGF